MPIQEYTLRKQEGLWQVWLDDRLLSAHPTQREALNVAEALANASALSGEQWKILIGEFDEDARWRKLRESFGLISPRDDPDSKTKAILLIGAEDLLCEVLAGMPKGAEFAVRSGGATIGALHDVAAGQSPPDIVLLDCFGSSDQITKDLSDLRELYPNAKLVLLCAIMTTSSLASAFAVGASGYLLKDVCGSALVGSLNLVAMGEKVFPSGLAELLIEMGGSQGSVAIATRFQQDSLTDRECEILACLARGDSNKRIAMSLAITEGTVKVHLKHVRRKINVRNRTQAAVWVLKHGLPRVAGAVAADQPASGRRDQPAADGNAISRAVPEPVLG